MKQKNIVYIFISFISVIAVLFVWQLCTKWLGLIGENVFPSPEKIVKSLIFKCTNAAPDGSTLLAHVMSSVKVALLGYLLGAIIGIPLGIFMAWCRKVELFVRPLFDLLRPMPPIAWIPIMIIFLGISTSARAAIIFMSSFVPCVLNSYTGIKEVKPVYIWTAQTFGAKSMRVLTKVAIPSSLPNIFTGLTVALSCSWSALVAAEMLASNRGLGYMIQVNRMYARPDLILGGMLMIGIIGALLSFVLNFMRKLLVKGGRY